MRSSIALTQHLIEHAHDVLMANVRDMSLDEALFTPSGAYRSAPGTLKHAAAWSRVYHSFAFESTPRDWEETDWPRGLRDTIDPSEAYLTEIIQWLDESNRRWLESLAVVEDAELDRPHQLHWGGAAPLFDTVVLLATHHVYHAGEINQLLAIRREEAWEEGEEVEENHIPTAGHRVKPPWQA